MTSIPQRTIRVAVLAVFSLALALGACSSNSSSGTGNGGSPEGGAVVAGGGNTSTGGTVATGGSTATPVTGGAPATGGTIQPSGGSTGGTSATGGTPTSGGSPATGGTSTTGGSMPAGGTKSSGGTIATGGTTTSTGGDGGASLAGGTTASGGKSGGTTASGGNAGGARGGTPATGGITASGGMLPGDGGILAAESASFHCFNWADAGDNFQKGALVLTGLSATDSYDTVLASSKAILSGFKTVLGANAFRMPINETTVNTAATWAAYKGIFDAAISQNVKVIVAYWLPPGSNHVADMTAWNAMWKVVVDAYATNDLVYFDIFNEPSGYSAAAFITLVQTWMTTFPTVPANKIIVAGTTTDIDVNQQGAALPNCLLSLHIYDSVGNTVAAAEAAVKTHAGPYYNRTIVTEYVGQSLFLQGITTQLKAYGMGSCYWAGLEGTGGIAKLSGTAPNYTLTVNNAATLTSIQSGWTQ